MVSDKAMVVNRFIGHSTPGLAFTVMGFWWMYTTLNVFYSNSKNSTADSHNQIDKDGTTSIELDDNSNEESDSKIDPIYDSANVNFGSKTKVLKSEGMFKVFFGSVAFFGHLIMGILEGGLTDEAQHFTIGLFFMLNGLVDIIILRSRRPRNTFSLPSGTDFAVGAMAWTSFGFLFLTHKHHKTAVNIYYHTLLSWSTISVAIGHLIQIKFQRNPLPSLLKSVCSALAGSWLLQLAYTFHNPFGQIQTQVLADNTTTPTSHPTHLMHGDTLDIMFTATKFTWHVISIIVISLILGFVISRRKQSSNDYVQVPEKYEL